MSFIKKLLLVVLFTTGCQKKEEISSFLADFENKHGFFSSHPLIGKVSDTEEDLKLTLELFPKLAKIQDPFFRFFATSEVITKVLAFRNLTLGMEITLPLKKEGSAIYTVDHVFQLCLRTPAYGLVPKEKSLTPILLFRGTDLSIEGLPSILSDFDPLGPGFHLFEKNKKELKNWLQKQPVRPRVMGYSLGGILSAYCILELKELISEKKASIAFQPPGVPKRLYRKWGSKSPPFFVITVKEDLVSKVGKQIGKVYDLTTELPPIEAHVCLISARKDIVDIKPYQADGSLQE